jgi:hypothetical protein
VVTLATLLDLKFKWGISLAALIRHLHSNSVINDQRKTTLYRQLYTRKNPETGRSYGATEPGWDRYTPERPALISAWLRHIIGTDIPEAISVTIKTFPPDLLASVLNEQRSASVIPKDAVRRSEGNGDVVRLFDRKSSRRSDENQLRLLLI